MNKTDIEKVLNDIRLNSITLSTHHKKAYYELKELIKYFKLPSIVLSAFNGFFSVGTQSYMSQQTISLTNCLISLICSIIISIELYLNIENSIRIEEETSRDYYILSVDIQKYLLLNEENRKIEPTLFLDKSYNVYIKLYEKSNLLKRKINDTLQPINTETLSLQISPSKNSSLSSYEI